MRDRLYALITPPCRAATAAGRRTDPTSPRPANGQLSHTPGCGATGRHKMYPDTRQFPLALVRANAAAKPMVECGPADKPHPGLGHVESVPCVHQGRREE